MRKFNLKMILLGMLCMCWEALQGIPAYPGLIDVKQPSGQTVRIKLAGDEFNHWATTPDGYTLLRDAQGYWAFAGQDSRGNVVVTDLRYEGSSAVAVQKQLRKGLIPNSDGQQRLMKQQMRKSNLLQIDNSFPTKGKRKLLLLLLNYADTRTTYTQTDFENFMNKPSYGGIGSFRDYYLEQSYGQLDIETTVTPWVTLSGDKRTYGPEGAVSMIVEGLKALDGQINLRDFDNDGDGVLDGLAVIHQGSGQEMTGDKEDIWSHSYEVNGFFMDGVQVRRYTIQPECALYGKMTNIGVICHEFGHNLGAPDFYDTDYEQTGGDFCGTGVWDLMGSGAWNGSSGDRPSGINMWQKWMFGWVEPRELTESEEITGMKASSTAPVAYKINTTVPGEYFILENRQQVGNFDVALPGSGLLIYHADESRIESSIMMNTLNITYPQALYTVCANAGSDPSSFPASYGDLTSDKAPFPGKASRTVFNDNTLPSSKSNSGRMSYFSISNIRESQGYISFAYTREKAPDTPQNLVAEANKGNVTLRWEAPQADAQYGKPVSYTIYCNNLKLKETSELTYVDRSPIDGEVITYSVDATYENGLVSPFVAVKILVPGNAAVSINAERTVEGNVLRWELKDRLTRIDINAKPGEYMEVKRTDVDSLDFVQCFSDADLTVYKGCRIDRVGIFPMTVPATSSYIVRVWETDKNGENPKVVASEEVMEFGQSAWRYVQLSNPVTLVKGRSYYVGAHVKCTNRDLSLLTDIGPYQRGGCLVKEGNNWREPDDLSGHFYVCAFLSMPNQNKPTVVEGLDEPVTDPVSDLAFPIGFRIYRDGVEIGTTGNRVFVDTEASEGEYRYTVSSLYKGGNESNVIGVVFDGRDPSGLNNKQQDTPEVLVSSDGWVRFNGVYGRVWLLDLMGRQLRYEVLNGTVSWQLPAGIYLLRTENETLKLHVN